MDTRFTRLTLMLVGSLAATLVPVAFGAESPPLADPSATYVPQEQCATCHEDMVGALKKTVHGRTSVTTEDGGAGCQSCHGPGSAHVAEGDKSKIRSLKSLAPAQVVTVCLQCHERGKQAYWSSSMHEARGLSCLSCHKIHQEADPPPSLLALDTVLDTCGSCHLKRRASLMRSAHMPLREGQMSCTSCHNPHGSAGPTMLKQFSVNDNCYTCHTEKRAPVLWEHPPVKESCVNCHDPHGTIHPRMLNAKLPRLCQQCHDETRHPTQPYASATTDPENFFPNSRMFDRSCMNCHSQIHGSNHPSGVRFNR